MLRHYVLVTMKDLPDRAENAATLQQKLEAICNENSKIKESWVRLNEVWDTSIEGRSPAADLVLYAAYESYEDLLSVRKDPQHIAMSTWFETYAEDKREVSFFDPPVSA